MIEDWSPEDPAEDDYKSEDPAENDDRLAEVLATIKSIAEQVDTLHDEHRDTRNTIDDILKLVEDFVVKAQEAINGLSSSPMGRMLGSLGGKRV
jgi:predicted  nucleic acid-binding Zn-ribbon protein